VGAGKRNRQWGKYMSDIFYTINYEGKNFNLELETSEEAQEYADGYFAGKVKFDGLADGLENGETVKDKCFIVKYTIDDNGNKLELSKSTYNLCYEHYRGDIAEHGTYF
jgi:hypothetical protein